jgi:hypothetical protein
MVTNFLIRKMYLLPLEGVRGEEPSLGEGLGRLLPLIKLQHLDIQNGHVLALKLTLLSRKKS